MCLVARRRALSTATAGIAQAALGGSCFRPRTPSRSTCAVLDASARSLRVEGVRRARGRSRTGSCPGGSTPNGRAAPRSPQGAEGRLWVAGDGRFRLELQSDSRRRADRRATGKQLTLLRPGVQDSADTAPSQPSGRPSASACEEPRARRTSGTGRRGARGYRGRSPAPSRASTAGPPELHGPRSRPRTTAGCSARPSWRGTRSRASRCAPRSTPRARTTRSSSSSASDVSFGVDLRLDACRALSSRRARRSWSSSTRRI